jgi:hypothetical protein
MAYKADAKRLKLLQRIKQVFRGAREAIEARRCGS